MWAELRENKETLSEKLVFNELDVFNVVSTPLGISAPIGFVCKFSVVMHGVTYLVVIHLVFTFLYSMWCVFMSVIVLAQVDYPLRTGVVGPFLVLCLFCLTFLVHMLCGSCTGGKCCFACGVNVFIVTNFVGKWIWLWKLNLSAWHPIRWRLTNISLKPLHVVFTMRLNQLCHVNLWLLSF